MDQMEEARRRSTTKVGLTRGWGALHRLSSIPHLPGLIIVFDYFLATVVDTGILPTELHYMILVVFLFFVMCGSLLIIIFNTLLKSKNAVFLGVV